MSLSDSVAAREASLARDVLDRIVLELDALPESGEGEIVSTRLKEAQLALAAVRDEEADESEHLARLDRAERELARLIGVLGRPIFGPTGARLAAALEPIRKALAEARAPTVEQLAAQPWRARSVPSAPQRFSTSQGVPRRFATADPAIAVPAPAAETPFAPPTIDVDELFAELHRLDEPDLAARVAVADRHAALVQLRPPRPAEDIDARGAPGELAQLHRIARDCLESIGVIGNLRRLEGDDRWGEATAAFEGRLLAKLDALMALGVPVPGATRAIAPLDATIRYAEDGPTGDVFRAFAHALVLGSNDSEEAARAAVVAMRRAPPTTLAAHGDGLALASGAGIEEALRTACREERDPERLAAILTVLRRRGLHATLAEVIPLLQHPDDRVRIEAVRCLRGDVPLLERALSDPSEEVVAAALEVLAAVDLRDARRRIRAKLASEIERPGTLARSSRAALSLLLAIAGDGEDATILQTALDDQPAGFEALGWHGHVVHVEPLLARLDAAGPVARAAARALHRITGGVGQGDAYAPTTSTATWRAWWQEHRAAMRDGRHRLGVAFSLREVAAELARAEVPIRDREILARELAIAGGPPLDVHGWAAAQQRDLSTLTEETFRGTKLLDSVPRGGWLSPSS